MSTADDLLSYIEHNHWEPASLSDDRYLLEINPVHGRIEAGFMLWRRLSNGEVMPVASGHASKGHFWGAENQPLDLGDEVLDVIAGLLKGDGDRSRRGP